MYKQFMRIAQYLQLMNAAQNETRECFDYEATIKYGDSKNHRIMIERF